MSQKSFLSTKLSENFRTTILSRVLQVDEAVSLARCGVGGGGREGRDPADRLTHRFKSLPGAI